jgi:Na+/proline symporter
VKVNAAGDHPDDVVRRIQTDISTWAPERGPRWAALQDSVRERPRQLFKIYAFAGVALAVILFGAFFAMAALDIGSLASQPVVAHSSQANP